MLRIAKIATAIVGAFLAWLGLLSGALYFLLPFVYKGDDLLEMNITVASFAALTLGLGLALAYQARKSLLNRPSSAFHPPSPWPLMIIFVVALVGGQLSLSATRLAPFIFPPFHLLGATLPALTILAFAGRRLRPEGFGVSGLRAEPQSKPQPNAQPEGLGAKPQSPPSDLPPPFSSWRDITIQVASGALLSPPLSLTLEAVFFILLTVVVMLAVALTPGGMAWIGELATNLQDPSWVEDIANLSRLLLSPPVLVIVIVLFVVIGPLIEELFKALGVVALSYRRPDKAQAFLWGLASGAGFAIAESLFNGALFRPSWGAIMLLRVGATLMHCLASGIMGLGWHYALVARRPWRTLGAYAASVGLHSLWNGMVISIIIVSLLTLTWMTDEASASPRPEDFGETSPSSDFGELSRAVEALSRAARPEGSAEPLTLAVGGLALLGLLGLMTLAVFLMLALLLYLTKSK